MLWYVLKLCIVLPLIGAMIWGTLKLLQKAQGRLGAAPGQAKAVRVIETTMLSPTLKLAVIEFHGREILVSASRNGLTRLAEAPARAPAAPTPAAPAPAAPAPAALAPVAEPAA